MSDAATSSPHHDPVPSVRVETLANVAALLEYLSCDPEAVFASAGLSPQQLLHPEERIPYATGARLLGHCVEASGCEHFGLLLGQWFLPAHMGIVGRLAGSAPDVATALRDIVDNLDLHDRGGLATLVNAERYAAFGYAVSLTGIPAVEQIYDFSITNVCGIMRSLCGMRWNPAEVHLSRSRPADERPYSEYFRAPVVFDAFESAILFPRELLNFALPGADLELHRQLATDALTMHEAMPLSLAEKVRDTMRRQLTRGEITAAAIADHFSLHERTLHRRLRAEGTSFRKLLDQVRRAVSQQYLAGTALSINDIAAALGYGSVHAFDHAFRRWCDTSPSRWRQSQLTR
jgi:AraC-like DNA-binding protein